MTSFTHFIISYSTTAFHLLHLVLTSRCILFLSPRRRINVYDHEGEFSLLLYFYSNHGQRHHKPAGTNPDMRSLVPHPLVLPPRKKSLARITAKPRGNLWSFWAGDEETANVSQLCCYAGLIIHGSSFQAQWYLNLDNKWLTILLTDAKRNNTWPNKIQNV